MRPPCGACITTLPALGASSIPKPWGPKHPFCSAKEDPQSDGHSVHSHLAGFTAPQPLRE